MQMELSVNVEQEHVHKVYSQIAGHFSDTRYKPWPRIAQFLNEQPFASLIADVGCGNGKYLGVNRSTYCLGSDICPELISIAGQREHEVIVCDCLQLPYLTGRFDAVICIAVIHHLSTEERRLSALKEMARILKSGGLMLVYVWAMEQDKRKFEAQDVMVPWHLQPKYTKGSSQAGDSPKSSRDVERIKERKRLKKVRRKQQKSRVAQAAADRASECTEQKLEESVSGAEGLLGDLSAIDLSDEDHLDHSETTATEGLSFKLESRTQHFIDSTEATRSSCFHKEIDVATDTAQRSTSPSSGKPGGPGVGYQTFQRYYHVFQQGELVELFSKLDSVTILEEFFDHENWCVIAKKL